MSYQGQVHIIPCNKGGLTGNLNHDFVEPEMMSVARNINLFNDMRETRGGTKKVNSIAISGSPRIVGLTGFNPGILKIVSATGNGNVYSDYTTQIATGLAINRDCFFEIYKSKLYLTNGSDVPRVWTGTGSMTSLATLPTDWTPGNGPTRFIRHNRQNSSCLFAYGCPNNPYMVYKSVNGSNADFSQGTIVTYYIETGDEFGVVGAIEYGNRLFFFGRNKVQIFNDASTNINDWGIDPVQWEGGAAHSKVIVKTSNDLLAMTPEMEIYSVSTFLTYGDYKAASVTRPSWIHKWIQQNVNDSKLSQFHAVYDPELRIVRWFIVRNGQLQVDTCLVQHIDKHPKDAWTIHDNLDYASGMQASCSAIVKVNPAQDHLSYVYTGGYNGFVWELEEKNTNDDGNGYWAGFQTVKQSINNPRSTKQFDDARLILQNVGNNTLNIRVWVDGIELPMQTVTTTQSTKTLGGSFHLNRDKLSASDGLSGLLFPIGAVGSRIQYEIFNTLPNQPFYISAILQDYQDLGVQPQG